MNNTLLKSPPVDNDDEIALTTASDSGESAPNGVKDRTVSVLMDSEYLEAEIDKALQRQKNTADSTKDRAMAVRFIAAKLAGLRFEEMSRILGTKERRLAEFLHGTITVPKKLDDRISRLEKILRNLHQVLEPTATGDWFRTPVPALGDETPLKAARTIEGLDELRALTQSYLDPSFG